MKPKATSRRIPDLVVLASLLAASWCTSAGAAPPPPVEKWQSTTVEDKIGGFASGRDSLFAVGGKGVYRSADGGISWKLVYNHLGDLAIAAGPQKLFVLDRSIGALDISFDDGTGFTRASGDLDSKSPVSLAVTGKLLYALTESAGVFRSSDDGTTWTAINAGLPVTDGKYAGLSRLYAVGPAVFVSVDRSDTEKGRLLRRDEGGEWSPVSGATGGNVLQSGDGLLFTTSASSSDSSSRSSSAAYSGIERAALVIRGASTKTVLKLPRKELRVVALAGRHDLVGAATRVHSGDDDTDSDDGEAGPLYVSPDQGQSWLEALPLPPAMGAPAALAFGGESLLVGTQKGVFRLPGVPSLARAALLFAAIAKKNLGYLKSQVSPTRTEPRDGRGRTLLHAAAGAGDLPILNFLLGGSSSVAERDIHGRTPLYEAIENDRQPAVKLLLGRGALLADSDADGVTPLHLAARLADPHLAASLLAAGASLSAADHKGRTPLHEAVAADRPETVALLLDKGADPGLADAHGRTAAMDAGVLERPDVMKRVLAYARTHGNLCEVAYQVFAIAVETGGAATATALMDACVDPNVGFEGPLTPLMRAARAGNVDTLRVLLKRGANPKLTDPEGRTALMLAAQAGKVEVLAALLDAKVDPDAKDRKGKTALELAESEGQEDAAELLRKRGAADPNFAKPVDN